MRLAAILLVAALVQASPAADPPSLLISYKGKTVRLDDSGLAKLPQLEIEATGHGERHRYGGVLLRDALALVGAPSGEALRGEAIALVVRISAADGYVAAFSLTDFDPAFSDRTILLANRQDGGPLPENAAPFRLVIPQDKRPARWVRQVTAIEIFSAKKLPQ